jgi:hypothetical protein
MNILKKFITLIFINEFILIKSSLNYKNIVKKFSFFNNSFTFTNNLIKMFN